MSEGSGDGAGAIVSLLLFFGVCVLPCCIWCWFPEVRQRCCGEKKPPPQQPQSTTIYNQVPQPQPQLQPPPPAALPQLPGGSPGGQDNIKPNPPPRQGAWV